MAPSSTFTLKRLGYGAISLAVAFTALWLRPLPTNPNASSSTVSWKSFSSDATCHVFNDTLAPGQDGLKYCEDIIHWESAAVAIVSCDGGRREWNTVMGPLKNPNPRGKLYLYHLDRPRSSSSLASKRNPYPLSLEGFPNNKDFHPLGIELFARDSQSARLFVANHRRDRSVIDVFELSAKDGDQIELLWSRTLTHSLINTPNSIVALSLNSLLVTNDHFMNRRQLGPIGPLLHTIEKFAHLPGGNVIALEFDEHHRTSSSETARVVAGGIAFANGLALTNDRATLIVASSTTRRLLFYRALPGSTQLAFTYVGARALPFGPDNLSINAEDELVVAGHPNVPRFMLWLLYPKRFPPAGSTIMRLNLREEVHDVSQLSVTNVFKDDGWFFATSSTGLLLGQGSKRRLIASGLYHHGLLECLGDEKA